MAFQNDFDQEPNRCCTLKREFSFRQNPPRRCEHFLLSVHPSACYIMSLPVLYPLPTSLPLSPWLPVYWLIIDYTMGAVIVCLCVWWVVWIKTKLMGSTSNTLMVEELIGQWVHSDLSLLRNEQSKGWWRLIYNKKWTQLLPLADIMQMSQQLTII